MISTRYIVVSKLNEFQFFDMYVLDIVQASKWYLFIEHFLNITLENFLRTVKKIENIPNTGFRVTY